MRNLTKLSAVTLFPEQNINTAGNKLLMFELYSTKDRISNHDCLMHASNFSSVTTSAHWSYRVVTWMLSNSETQIMKKLTEVPRGLVGTMVRLSIQMLFLYKMNHPDTWEHEYMKWKQHKRRNRCCTCHYKCSKSSAHSWWTKLGSISHQMFK